MQQVSEILQTQQSQTPSSPLVDILTESEKKEAVEWAILQRKKQFWNRKRFIGLPDSKIEILVQLVNWDLTINKEEVISSANQRKHWHVEDEQRKMYLKEQMLRNLDELRLMWNADYFKSIISTFFLDNYQKFDYDETTKLYIDAVCYFFSTDTRFVTELGFKFSKGLLVMGTAGLGKTKTIMAVASNPLKPVSIFSMIEISQEVAASGSVNLNTSNTIMLDDVGSETAVVKHYGTSINWFKDFIETYYLNHKDYSKLIITTNLGGDEIERIYGYRVRSRLREMCNIIQLKGHDKR